MTTAMTPESIRQFFEKASKAYADSWKTQAEYLDGLVRRNTQCLTELADARLASFKEMSEARTFNQAFEANLAFEEKVREELVDLQDANTRSWEDLLENLKSIYIPAKEAPESRAAAPKKPTARAPAPKKRKAKSPAAKSTRANKAA